jgi:hypothetical protein
LLDGAWLRLGAFSGRHERKASLLDCGVRLISEGFHLKTLCSLRLALYRRALPSTCVELAAHRAHASYQATMLGLPGLLVHAPRTSRNAAIGEV